MKTRAYGDMEKLFDQNNINFRNHITSPSKSRDQEKDKDPNQSPDPEDEMPDFVRKRLQKLKNQQNQILLQSKMVKKLKPELHSKTHFKAA